jgi:hypothetical protein
MGDRREQVATEICNDIWQKERHIMYIVVASLLNVVSPSKILLTLSCIPLMFVKILKRFEGQMHCVWQCLAGFSRVMPELPDAATSPINNVPQLKCFHCPQRCERRI